MATATVRREYMLGEAEEERARLIAQAELLDDEARELFDRIGVPAGGRAVDIGCGPIGVLPLLAERVGPHGRVTGLDRHADMLEHAARSCAGLGNVDLVLGDATDSGLPRGAFDVAHVRLLLVNVPDPAAVVREATALVRSSGVVAVQEVDWLSWQCEPAHPAWDRLRGHLQRLWSSRGLDPCVGRRLPALLRAAGLRDVQAQARAGIDGAGQPYQRLILTFATRFRERMVDAGIATGDELDELVAGLAGHLDHPATVVVRAMTVQAWGTVGPRP